jgi:predicted HNH restriction endonuclease
MKNIQTKEDNIKNTIENMKWQENEKYKKSNYIKSHWNLKTT